MLNFIKNLFNKKEPEFSWAKVDQPAVLDNAISFDEIVATANPVNWKQLDPNIYNYPVRNQGSSGSCVAATFALICSIMYFLRTGTWIDFSFMFIYTQRSNKPDEGMFGSDVWTKGIIPDDLMPSDNKTEKQMNEAKIYPWLNELAKTFQMGTPIIIPVRDIDKIASVIQTTGKPIQIFVQFGTGEWNKVPKILSDKVPYGHSVTVLDFGMYEGEKSLLIQDSWGKDLSTINGKRIIKDSFYSKRNCFAQYFMNFRFDIQDVKPKYDGSIKSLQDCLKYEGCFPSNIESTGTFGSLTKESVIKFQVKYKLYPTLGNVGPLTKKKLSELFN